ncbi:MAG: endonuclease/exonuclease/phosphatase family protein [Pseudomonadota bacterium]
MSAAGIAGFILALIVVATTFASLTTVNIGAVRIWDFPAIETFIVGLVALSLLAMSGAMSGIAVQALSILLAVSLVVQVDRFVRYLPLMPTTAMAFADGPAGSNDSTSPDSRTPLDNETTPDNETAANNDTSADGRCVTILTANVLQDNRNADDLLKQIEARDPDIVLLLETDAWWYAQTGKLRARYRHQRADVRDNTYGLIFLTRLEGRSQLTFRIEDVVPSIAAWLETGDGTKFRFFGVHPRPPGLTQDTDERDAELIQIAWEVRHISEPAVIVGDLNDVGWSRTTKLFLRLSRMVDPRIGRGLFATFHAKIPFLNWPLDHVFHTPDVQVRELALGEKFGSDHRPVFSHLCMPAKADL